MNICEGIQKIREGGPVKAQKERDINVVRCNTGCHNIHMSIVHPKYCIRYIRVYRYKIQFMLVRSIALTRSTILVIY